MITHKALSKNLLTIANSLHLDSDAFRIETSQDGSQVIKKNNWFQRWFSACEEQALHSLIERNIQMVSELDRSAFIDAHTLEPTELFLAVQKYNQTISAAKAHPLTSESALSNRVQLGLVRNDRVPELNPSQIVSVTSLPMAADLRDDKPEIVEERRFFSRYDIRRYPGDRLDHSEEAGCIFVSTQIERLLSAIGRVVEAVARFFGFEVTYFQKYHYFTQGETDQQIYAEKTSPLSLSDEPSSYWLGHATLFLNVPLRSESGRLETFHVITDPVEGDLNAILYPRQTKFARKMEKVPAPHVYLLSHNHLDHYSKESIQKLFAQQPLMIVPKGDGERYARLGKDLGFDSMNIIELDWWEGKEIEFEKNGECFQMKITATPARHWSGQGPCGGHESTFLGYVIQGHESGDIYFAGDTARLGEDHIKKLSDHFNIKWNFQPGGPDEVRRDMESTHQASVDALWMHFKMMIPNVYDENLTKEGFLARASDLKTIYMHTMTYKLGNLHFNDTKESVDRVLKALTAHEATERTLVEIEAKIARKLAELREKLSAKKAQGIEARVAKRETELRDRLIEKKLGLKSYEKQVYSEICSLSRTLIFNDGSRLLPKEAALLLRETVIIPKIGSRIALETSKVEQARFAVA